MPLITTLCLNPSFDRTVEVAAMTIGGTNRISAARMDAGGKGVNVMRVCQRLGVKAQCVMLAGREDVGRFQAMLAEEGLADLLHVCLIDGGIRVNTKIVSLDGQPVTELNERGPQVDREKLLRAEEMLSRVADRHSFTVLTGSLPPGSPEGTYAHMMQTIGGEHTILDVGGRELMLGLAVHPFLIKPNIDELQSAVGRELSTKEAIVSAARELLAMGARNAVVSMGGDGAMLVTPDEAVFAPTIPVEVSSTVGAGDAMVGGMICALERGASIREAFVCAVAAGSASVMTEGTQLIRLSDYEELLPRVRLEAL